MPSIRSRLMRRLIQLAITKGNKRHIPVTRIRRRMECFMTAGLPLQVRIEPVSAGGVPGEWVIPGSVNREVNGGPTLLYLHGGGYIAGSLKTHRRFVTRLVKELDMPGFHVDYRLAPEHPFPAAVEDCFAAYQWLLHQGVPPESLVIGGESAGGAFVITTLLQARDNGMPLPVAGFCFSPHVDFCYQGESITTRAAVELFLTRDDLQWGKTVYAGNNDPHLPLLSPLYADLRGLPPLLIQAADDELFRDDAVRLAARAREAGVEVELKIWEELWHAFQLFPFIPESRQAIEEVCEFINKRIQTPGVRIQNKNLTRRFYP
ncbi:MAG TPA: alpha/beta hydrolase [Gammaproteobacteria bacterium]